MTAMATAARLDPKLIYALDAVASLAMGVILLLASEPLTNLAGWGLQASFLFGIGVFLLPWSAFNMFIARSTNPSRSAVRANLVVDATWIVGTLALLVAQGNTLSGLGLALLAGQGLAVGAVLAIKLLGARALVG